MTIEVMLDLETMSTESNAAITSIGAVKFDPRGDIGVLGDPNDSEYQPFHQNVELNSLTDCEFHISGRTIHWWLEQSEEARQAMLKDPVDIGTALSRFYIWFGDVSLPTWGNGAGFDNVVLRNAFQKLGGVAPFKYSHDRCYRTIKSLFPDVPFVPPVVAHSAVADAVAQAVHLQKLFNRINFKG